MVFGKFIKRLVGSDAPVEINDDPFGSRPPPPPSARPPEPESEPPPAHPIVQRDEIIDDRSRIAGYRFSVRRPGTGPVLLPQEAAAQLDTENLPAFAARRLALIPLAAGDWMHADFRRFIAPGTTFLVNAPGAKDTAAIDAWLDTLRDIKAAGGRVAVGDDAVQQGEGLAEADLLLLDMRNYALDNFERLLRRLRRLHPALAIAVDGVASWSEHRLCQSLGATYSLGGFAASRDEEDRSERLNQSRLILIEMLNLLRNDAELSEVSAVAKRDPGVALKIVAMANSPVAGLSSPVASLEQAMMVLGRSTIYRWLSITMFRAGDGGGRDETLLELALWRARFLELVAGGTNSRQECDELFLVGLLSLLDSLLGVPMDQIVRKMNLPESVAEVLLYSQGPYGRFLLLALAVEKGRDEQAGRLAAMLAMPMPAVDKAARDARQWAETALDAG